MIQISELSKSFAGQVLFQNASFALGRRERLGLVGRNGHGKSTLLKIIAGELEPDAGKVIIPSGYRLGMMSQKLDFTMPTILEEASRGLTTEDGAWQREHLAEKILTGLGFAEAYFSKPPQVFSGGFQVRLQLAKLLLSEPNLLLLDEPTNYLDIVSLRWLIQELKSWDGEIILITHEQDFMDQVATHILGIHRQKIRKFQGATAHYYQQLANAESTYELTRQKQEKVVARNEAFIERFRAKASKASAAKSRAKMLEKLTPQEKLAEINNLHFRFSQVPFPGKWLIEVENISFAYAPELPQLISSLSFAVAARDRIAIIGKNGQGKSTLLRLLAQELSPTAGLIKASQNISSGYFGQTNVDALNPELTVEEEVQAADSTKSRTEVRGICGAMMFGGPAAEKPIKVLSGGERSRVLLGKVVARPANCLLLDEPTNHLDLESAASFASALQQFAGAIVMVTHSEMLLKNIAQRLIVFDAGRVSVFEGGYQDFLDGPGWSDENLESRTKPAAPTASKAALRQSRAEETKRRAPLKKEMRRIEDLISQKEERMAELNQILVSACQDQQAQEIITLSKEFGRINEECQRLYQQLEDLLLKLERES